MSEDHGGVMQSVDPDLDIITGGMGRIGKE
jgi:hypothetical protein